MPQLTPEQRQRLAIDPDTGRAPKSNPLQLMNQIAAMKDAQQAQSAPAPSNDQMSNDTANNAPAAQSDHAPAPKQLTTVGGGQPPTSNVADYGQPALESIWNSMAPKAAPGKVGQVYSANE